MFEKLSITRQESTLDPLNLGLLAESLVFYQNVHITTDFGMMEFLLKRIGPDVLYELIDLGALNLTHLEDKGAIQTQNTGKENELHQITFFTTDKYKAFNFIPPIFQDFVGKSGKGRRMASRFLQKIHTENHENGLGNIVLEELSDTKWVEDTVKHLLAGLVPGLNLSNDFKFEVEVSNGQFRIGTNLDFEKVNKLYHQYVPATHSTISKAYIIVHFLSARCDIAASLKHTTDLATSLPSSIIINTKLNHLISKRAQSQSKIETFNDFIFSNSIDLKNAINSGKVNFKELLPVIEKSMKFKEWLLGKAPDANLLAEYVESVSRETLLEKLPTRSVRWALFTLIGAALEKYAPSGFGAGATAALSIADTFLIDKIIGGWKPNQFIENDLMKMLEKNSLDTIG